MAPEEYWRAYLEHPKAGDWLPVMQDLLSKLRSTLVLEVHLSSLRDAAFEFSLEGRRPRLTGKCRIVSVHALVEAR